MTTPTGFAHPGVTVTVAEPHVFAGQLASPLAEQSDVAARAWTGASEESPRN